MWNTGRVEDIVSDLLQSFPYFLPSPFLLPSSRAVRSYRPHLEERDPVWGDDWSHNPFIRRSPSWGFLGFSSVIRQVLGDLCTAPRIISLSPLSLVTDVTDATLGASGLWLGTRAGAGGPATLTESFIDYSPWLHGQQTIVISNVTPVPWPDGTKWHKI